MSMKSMAKFIFMVEGTGGFPAEMLHLDQCFPETVSDSDKIDYRPSNFMRRRVTLVHWAPGQSWYPNCERWERYGWQLVACMQSKETA